MFVFVCVQKCMNNNDLTLAVIESEVLTTARINVMKIAGRILVKAFRTAGKQLAARRKQESEDNEIREQIINNKTASRPWLDVIVQKMKLAPKLKSRLQGIATKVKTKSSGQVVSGRLHYPPALVAQVGTFIPGKDVKSV